MAEGNGLKVIYSLGAVCNQHVMSVTAVLANA